MNENVDACGSCLAMERKNERTEKQAALKGKNKPVVKQVRMGIKKVSDKKADQLKDYNPLRTEYLEKHPKCMASLEMCTFKATEIHHASTSDLDHNNPVTWLAVCRNCHHQIETVLSAKDRRQQGFLI